jgi:hypothetical protein
VLLGLVVAAALLTDQESAVLVAVLAAAALLPWLAARPSWAKLRAAALAAAVFAVAASPQIIAMIQQTRSGGAQTPPRLLAESYVQASVSLPEMFANPARSPWFGAGRLYALFAEGARDRAVPWFGIVLPALDRPIAADHSGSIVVDVPFGIRGGIPEYGWQFNPEAQVLATADGHPLAVGYFSRVPLSTIAGIQRIPFYAGLMNVQRNPAANTPALIAAARRSARRIDVGWVLVWTANPAVDRYLAQTGFRLAYRADGVSVYRPAGHRARAGLRSPAREA